MKHNLKFESTFPFPVEKVFSWHENAGALIRLMPPWEKVQVVSPFEGLHDGVKVRFKIKNGPITMKWTAEHFDYRKNEQFCDRALSGPFKTFVHHHKFSAKTADSCTLSDEIEYSIPITPLSDPVAGWFVEDKLKSMFAYRHRITQGDLQAQARHNLAPKRILISGSNGLIGTQLYGYLLQSGHDVWRLVRSKSEAEQHKTILWQSNSPIKNPEQLEGFNAVVHLAGAGIADERWTASRKKLLRSSRVDGTKHLTEALAKVSAKPEVLISGSAIGIYGNQGDSTLSEESPTNVPGFLEELARDWEAAAKPAEQAGIRTVYLRTGIVLSPAGGALGKMLLPFQLNLGGRLGSGKAWMSWISIDDMISGIEFLISNSAIVGPVNLTAPNPARNVEFTKTLAQVLKRFVGPPAPAAALRLIMGEMADAALLASLKVNPNVLLNYGYQYRYPDLKRCLEHVTGMTYDNQ
ncbi:MAG: TIGR01777 family oxidoreductase [Sumerlaeia bacterium]